MELLQTLELINMRCSPSGFEAGTANTAAELMGKYFDSVNTDRLGNIIGIKRCGKDVARTLMLDAHIDQVGFIVTDVDDGGFVRVKSIGGIDCRVLPSSEVKILTEPPIYGVFTSVPPHLQNDGDGRGAPTLDELYIDCGIKNGAKELIKIGTPAVFAEKTEVLSGSIVSGGGIDNRLGFAVLLRVMDKLNVHKLNVDLALCGTACEEIGGAGAKTAAYALDPDFALAVDTTHASTHDCSNEQTFELGGGPLIGMGPNLDRGMSKKLVEIARDGNIKYGLEVMEGSTGTNAWQIQTVREGIRCALVSVPIRYMHTPTETADLNDAEAAAELIAQYILTLK